MRWNTEKILSLKAEPADLPNTPDWAKPIVAAALKPSMG